MPKEILESLSHRDSLWGIGTAARFIASMSPCFSGGDLCPTKLFKLADEKLWTKELEEAVSRLTFSTKEMHDNDVIEKSLRSGADIAKGAVMEYDCVLSARSRDRDGDLLEQKGGMELDLDMPLLWQHIRLQPIGKLVKQLSQTEDETRARFAIVDTELGRDAAKLAAFGALRKSHGFVPKEYLPLETKKMADGKEIVLGWHVKKSLTVEGSLVSVPSNDRGKIFRLYQKEFDGICTVFGRGELKSEAVKAWAKGFYDSRPTIVPGVFIKHEDGSCTCGGTAVEPKDAEQKMLALIDQKFDALMTDVVSALVVASEKKLPDRNAGESSDDFMARCMHDLKGEFPKQAQRVAVCMSQGRKPKKELGAPVETKDLAASVSEKMLGMDTTYVPGSWEWIQARLGMAAAKYLTLNDVVIPSDVNVYVVATFAETAIVCCSSWSYDRLSSRHENKTSCFELSWSVGEDGEPEWQGEPKEVSLSVSVTSKDLAASGMRSVIGKAFEGNHQAILALKQAREACELLDQQNELAGLLS